MKCPNCGFEQEDKLQECGKCQIIFSKWYQKKAREAGEPPILTPKKEKETSSNTLAIGIVTVVVIIGALVLFNMNTRSQRGTSGANKAGSENKEKVSVIAIGERVNLEDYLVDGKIVIFDFYAEWCGPCKVLGPMLEDLAKSDEDILLRKIDIVNWNSAVCGQYGIQYVPNVRVYDKKGRQVGTETSDYNVVVDNVKNSK